VLGAWVSIMKSAEYLHGCVCHRYGLTAVKNAEVRFRWQVLCLRASYNKVIPAVVEFITTQGRMKVGLGCLLRCCVSVNGAYDKLSAVRAPIVPRDVEERGSQGSGA